MGRYCGYYNCYECELIIAEEEGFPCGNEKGCDRCFCTECNDEFCSRYGGKEEEEDNNDDAHFTKSCKYCNFCNPKTQNKPESVLKKINTLERKIGKLRTELKELKTREY